MEHQKGNCFFGNDKPCDDCPEAKHCRNYTKLNKINYEDKPEEERIKKVLLKILQERQVTHLSAGTMICFCNVCGNRADILVDGVCNCCKRGQHKLYTTKEVIEVIRRLVSRQ